MTGCVGEHQGKFWSVRKQQGVLGRVRERWEALGSVGERKGEVESVREQQGVL